MAGIGTERSELCEANPRPTLRRRVVEEQRRAGVDTRPYGGNVILLISVGRQLRVPPVRRKKGEVQSPRPTNYHYQRLMTRRRESEPATVSRR